MAFWGCVLIPGQKKTVESPEGEILHLSQACLHDPKDGKNYIQAEVNGTTYSIACLEKGKKEHDSFDLFFDPSSCAFKNNGKSEVHLTGYFEPDEGFDEDDEEEEPVPKKSPKVEPAKAASPKVEAKSSPKVVAKESPKAAKAASPKASPKAAPADEDDDEESEEELIEGEEGEEEELLEESEEEDAPPPAKAGKRKAESTPAAAPPAKKAAGSPGSAPAASGHAAYVKQLVDYLKKNGKTSVSTLGSKVQRPQGAPKMKVIFSQNPDKFNVQGENVTAK